MRSAHTSSIRLLVVLFIILSVISVPAGQAIAQDELSVTQKLQVQNFIAQYVRSEYVDSLDVKKLYDGAIEGMIDQLDPHSSYMPPETYDDFSERIRGNFQGIGITFAMIDDTITVIEVIEGGPSEKAGITSRDRIVKIEGEDATGIDSETVKERLRGPAGSKVTVQVERPGVPDLLSFPIIRERVDMNSVSHAYMLDETTGYISLSRFTLRSHIDVLDALKRLQAQGMEQLVLDLRGNSGGSLDAAIHIVDTFIPDGVIVSTQGKQDREHDTWEATGKAPYPDLPMVVMINHGSASASEIVAGALQDHDRALVVGQTSFGKGLVMNPYRLQQFDTNLGTLMLTIARYYTPSGRLIQRPYDGTREEYIEEGFDDYDPNAVDIDKSDRPVFMTDLGREVYGGGGITPDEMLSGNDRLNAFERDIRATNLLFRFADEYLNRHTDVPQDFDTFLTSYRVPDDELRQFHEFAKENDITSGDTTPLRDEFDMFLNKHDITDTQRAALEEASDTSGIKLDETLFEQSKPFLEREIKMEIARMVWGGEYRYRVWHREDNELIGARTYFPEAAELLRQRLAIGKLDQ